jgi:hypothetical protein
MNRKLHVDNLNLIHTLKYYAFLYSRQTDRQMDGKINQVWASITRYYKSVTIETEPANWFPAGLEQTQNRLRTESEIFNVGIVENLSCNFP